MSDAPSLEGITRWFGRRTALDDVTFDVRPGRLTGCVGANNAGTMTAMRITMGVLAPDAGPVTPDGWPPDLALRHRFGCLPEERGLYPKAKIAEQLTCPGWIHALDPATAASPTAQLLDPPGSRLYEGPVRHRPAQLRLGQAWRPRGSRG